MGISGIDVYVVIDKWLSTDTSDVDVDALQNLRTLRIVRVLRFFRVLKLLRVMRAARIFARWESKIAINYNSLQLIKSVTAAFVVSHWIACLWITQAFMQGDDAPMKSWLTDSFPYCRTEAYTVSPKGYVCESPGLLYLASLYHTTLCLFGGLEATAGNGVEMLVATLLMLLSGLVWSHVMATVVGIVSMSDPDETAFRATMDSLNGYMNRELVPSELRQRAREYFQKSKHVRKTDTRNSLLELMPYSLQAELVLFTSRVWIDRVWFLKGLDGEDDYPFLVDFAKQVSAKVFAPGDWAPSGFLYIIHRGIALYKAQVLTRGKVFGDDFLLASESIRDQSSARAMNYLEVYVCNREDVQCLAEKFPETWRKVRKRVLFRTMRKAIVGKKDELLSILDKFRVMVEQGLINEDDDPVAKKAAEARAAAGLPAVASQAASGPALAGVQLVERGTPGPLQRARHARNKSRAERRAGPGGMLSGMGAAFNQGLVHSNTCSPMRAQIDVGGIEESAATPEPANGNGQQHDQEYEPLRLAL